MNLAHEKPLVLTPKDEEILETIYTYRYATTLDIAHLLFRPTYLPYVRKRLARLAEGKDLQENTYLCRFKLPSTDGNRERIFTLGNKGREFLRQEKGKIVDWHFQPGRLKFFSYSAILHHLLLTRFLVAARWGARQQAKIALLEERVSYELARTPPKITVAKKSLTVIPDAWLLFGKRNGQSAVIFELDRGMEYQQKFKEHVRGRNELPRSKLRGINPPLADSYGPPVWRGRAGVSCVCFPANLRTTPAGRPGDAVAYSLCHCPVVLHMLQKPKQASRNLTQEIELIRTGEYQRVFGVPGVIISYLTTGETPQYRNTRVKTMNVWTREVLAETNKESWGGIFRFTAVEFDNLYDQAGSLFEEPIWLRPDTRELVRLFE